MHIHVSQRETMLRNHCFAERFRSQVCDVFFAPDSAHSQSLDLIPSCTHKYATSMCFNFPIPCLENVFSGFCVNGQPDFTAKPKSHIMLWTPSLLTLPMLLHTVLPPALFFAMTFCFRVYAFRVCPPSISTPAHDDFRCHHVHSAADRFIHFCSELLDHVCYFPASTAAEASRGLLG